ncbi:acyl carrier protein [Chloroflexi bacterium TSY]|nr:acyl carrier protein [Chloroflexi bacterium TSY]
MLNIDEARVVSTAHVRDDLGADSLDIVELITTLSNTFEINVRDHEVQQISTIGETAAYIDRKLAGQYR